MASPVYAVAAAPVFQVTYAVIDRTTAFRALSLASGQAEREIIPISK